MWTWERAGWASEPRRWKQLRFKMDFENGFAFLFIRHIKSSSRFLKSLNHSLSKCIPTTLDVLLLMILKSTLFNVWNMHIYMSITTQIWSNLCFPSNIYCMFH